MAQFRVGCVPYVNARPLVAAFDQPNEFVEVVYDVPSKLPALLDAGEVDAILVSSIELLRRNDLLPVAEVGIMSNGPVKSVRMLSKVPISEIKTLALDESSMTSNMLAQVILAEQGVFPTLTTLPPDSKMMLANCDACVIIGDHGFEADGSGLVDIDLGEAWTKMTGLPFVWALWLGKKEQRLECKALYYLLQYAFLASGFYALHDVLDQKNRIDKEPLLRDFRMDRLTATEYRRKFVIDSAVKRSSWTSEQVEGYLTDNVRFDLPKADFALETFANMLTKHELVSAQLPVEMRYQDMQKIVMDLITENSQPVR